MNIVLLSGSPAVRSRSNALLEAVGARLASAGHGLVRLGLRDVPSDDLVFARHDGVAARRVAEQLARAEAVVVATPVYQASIAGGLKALLDLLPQSALAGKLVVPLATGGSAAHQLVLDFALKPVLAALGAQHLLAGIYACNGQVQLLDDGAVRFADEIDQRIVRAADAVLEHLAMVHARRPATAARLVPAAASLDRHVDLRCSA